MPHDEQEFEELVKLLEGYESSQRQGLGPLPGDLQVCSDHCCCCCTMLLSESA
jgi:hypothetical protein